VACPMYHGDGGVTDMPRCYDSAADFDLLYATPAECPKGGYNGLEAS
jgi:hypothetical protein